MSASVARRGLIGRLLPRREDARLLVGAGQYLDDLARPEMAHAAFVRSPHAHAAVVSVTPPPAAPGLVAVLTAADLEGVAGPLPVAGPPGTELCGDPHPVLAAGEVRYVGQPVALVLAESPALAEDLAERVQVDYEPLPVCIDPLRAPALLRWSGSAGDVVGAFSRAAHVVRGRYRLPRLAAAPIEPRGAIASLEAEDGVLTVWCSAQDPHRPREQLAEALGLAAERVRVIVPDVGGAFGSKGAIGPELAALAAAALLISRPLKWVEQRIENFEAAYQGRGMEGELELALDGEGRMLGLRGRLWADTGAYLLATTAMPPHTAANLLCGCYDIPAAEVSVVGAATHKVPTGPYRGAGRPEAAYMLERLVDDAAQAFGCDRVDLRRRNLVRSFPHRAPLGYEYDSGDYERCLDEALSLLREGDVDPPPGWVGGWGVALYVERAGGGFESARLAVGDDGSIDVWSSACPHGQGHDITFAQIAAERLGCPLERVRMHFGDSASVPAGVGTFGSRSVAMAGSAVAVAADELLSQAAGRPWEELAGLTAEARFSSPQVFSSGAHAAVVHLELATGRLRVVRLVAVDDAGNLINPLLAAGQVVGGVVQALGECLTEEVVHDGEGQLLTGSFVDYGLLTAADVPPIVVGEVSTPSPHNPLGAKGAGEGGAVGALPAVACAVCDALGGMHVDPPFTSEKLWRALQGVHDPP